MRKTLLLIIAVLIFKVGYSNNYHDDKAQQIYYYYLQGLKADNDEKENASIGDALRYYYWSLVLCYTHPDGSKMNMYSPETNQEILIKEWLNDRIDTLLQKINFILKKKPVFKNKNSVAYELVVTDGADRVPWLKFEYNNGHGYIESSVESGIASVELLDKGINNIDIMVSLENKPDAEARAKEVYAAMEQLGSPIYFASAVKKIDLRRVKEEEEKAAYQDEVIIQKQSETKKLIDDNLSENMDAYLKAMKAIEKSLRNKDISTAKNYFTVSGYKMFETLFSSGRYYILGTPEYKFVEFKNLVICRNIPMQFNFKNNVGFVRNVVFRFDKESQKVESLAFRLTDIAEIDILGKELWNPESRMTLVNFLEDYQTAYALKRIDYLDMIFSDEALIVVGTVLKQKPKGDKMHLSNETKVRYDTLSKSRYIEKLHTVFNNNEFVNIRFMDTDFTQHKKYKELYGIQVKQEYLSSSYGDVGYLFLMVDLRGELPIIHVRTWEPEKTKNPIGFDNITVE